MLKLGNLLNIKDILFVFFLFLLFTFIILASWFWNNFILETTHKKTLKKDDVDKNVATEAI